MDREKFTNLSAEFSGYLQARFVEIEPDDVAHPGLEFAQKVRKDLVAMAAKRLDAPRPGKASEYAFLAALSSWYDNHREVKRLRTFIRKKLTS